MGTKKVKICCECYSFWNFFYVRKNYYFFIVRIVIRIIVVFVRIVNMFFVIMDMSNDNIM